MVVQLHQRHKLVAASIVLRAPLKNVPFRPVTVHHPTESLDGLQHFDNDRPFQYGRRIRSYTGTPVRAVDSTKKMFKQPNRVVNSKTVIHSDGQTV